MEAKISGLPLPAFLLRLVLLGIFNVLAFLLMMIVGNNISWLFGGLVGFFAVIVNIVFLNEKLFAWRWIVPAVAGMVLLVIYPIGYSVIIAFTNYGDGHLITKNQAIAQFQKEAYIAEGAAVYDAFLYLKPGTTNPTRDDFLFYLIDASGKGFIGANNLTAFVPEGDAAYTLGAKDDRGRPQTINDKELVTRPAPFSQVLDDFSLRNGNDTVKFARLVLLQQKYEAVVGLQKYTFDAATNTLRDNETGTVYREVEGTFVTGEGENVTALTPGFAAFIGTQNFTSVITDARIRDPFLRVFVWTVVFAIGSVLSTFGMGLLFAILLNARSLPLRVVWRSLLIIPYAIPFWLSVQTWRGLLNPIQGPIAIALANIFGVDKVDVFGDSSLAKLAVLFVNLYLGFPYMMLICLGALQSIPADMYEAALIDGANDRQQFQFITLPMILLAVGPLLIASFAFNFNNFVIIELLTSGGPPISVDTVAGHTDILLSYVYRIAFGGARGTQYGFAAAIGIFIFIIVGSITFFNFRFTRKFEEIGQ
jgi:arabinogalactan oligomer / maltooligosaccharide transport system permease protein